MILVIALKRLRPGAQFSCTGDDIDTVVWHVLDGDPPSRGEIEAAMEAIEEEPQPNIVDGTTFLGRVTNEEYLTVVEAGRTNGQVGKWLELLRLRGEIDLNGATAKAAKAGLVALGLLTQRRADEIFS